MKKSLSLLTLLSLVTLMATTWSCVPKDTTPPAVGEVTKLDAGDPKFPSTSVGVKLNVTNIESYVLRVDEGENIPTPDPVMMYADAKEITPITDGEHKVFVYGMEGNKTYTVHFAMKIKGTNKYLVQSISSSTPNYSRLINLIAADRFEIKVQFNVPADQNFRYVIMDVGNYWERGDDLSKLKQGILKKGPQVITYTDNGPTGFKDPETGEDSKALVKPGGAFVVLMAYCDKDGVINYTGGDKPKAAPQYVSNVTPNEKSYTEKCSDPDYTLLDPYAKLVLVTAQPKVGEGEFVIEQHITELSSIFTITPPPSIVKYTASIMDEAGYNQQVSALGEDGICEWILRNSQAPLTGEQTVSNREPMRKGEKYKLIIIGQCDQTGETQIRKIIAFEPGVSTEPAVKLDITNVTKTTDGPYKIVYNIKAPNKDCYAIRYILNYVKEIEPMLGSGMTYSDIILKYGQPTDATWITKINSDAGLDLPFDTFEDMDNRLIVASFNSDEKMEVFHKDIRSAAEPPKTRVESPLFRDMLGDWNVEFKYRFSSGDESDFTAKFTTKIVDGPAVADPSFKEGDKMYEKVLKYYYLTAPSNLTEAEKEAYAKKTLADELDKYITAESKFKRKYREQNRLVMNGFCYDQNMPGTDFRSAWDLFCETANYVSYDIDQLFFDYGPKLFLEIHDWGKVTLETNRTTIAPFSYYNMEHYVGGFLDNTACFQPFEVVLDGNDKITIKMETSYEGTKYPFAIITNGMADIYAVSDIVLTRASASQVAAAKKANNFNHSLEVFNLDKKPRRTSLAGSTNGFKKVEVVKIPILKGF